jgi:hypothetical protein
MISGNFWNLIPASQKRISSLYPWQWMISMESHLHILRSFLSTEREKVAPQSNSFAFTPNRFALLLPTKTRQNQTYGYF